MEEEQVDYSKHGEEVIDLKSIFNSSEIFIEI
jgi:hypothetical protein